MMNFIDISSHQKGIDLAVLFQKNPALDGVIVKATEGTSYTNPEAKGWLDWLMDNGKPFGTYHYLGNVDAVAEAQYYVRALKDYPGGTLAIDYEDAALRWGPKYAKACLDEVYRLTGVRPFIYCSQSVVRFQDFKAIAEAGYPFWMAQYAGYNIVNGFLDKPWQQGSVGPFQGYAMQQYTSCGRLIGWGKNLDFDQFRGDTAEWAALAGTKDIYVPSKPAELKGPDPCVVSDILHGKYGIGADRAEKLKASGYDPAKVQAKVDELYGIAASCKKYVRGNEDYLNSIDYIIRAL